MGDAELDGEQAAEPGRDGAVFQGYGRKAQLAGERRGQISFVEVPARAQNPADQAAPVPLYPQGERELLRRDGVLFDKDFADSHDEHSGIGHE